MNNTEFDELNDASPHNYGIDTVTAMRLVLVEGLSAYRASREVGIDESGLYRALRQFPLGICPRCKQAILP